MIQKDIPLQIDLFTGNLVDTRTTEQKRKDAEIRIPTQLLMFSQRDMLQIGVSPTPRMDLSPGRLRLIAEDPRTPDEIEQDLLRAAKDQTLSLFESTQSKAPVESSDTFTPPTMPIEPPPDEDDDPEQEETPIPPEPPLTKFAAYQAIVAAIAETTATTNQSSEPMRLAQSISVSLATHNAKRAGLTDAEMKAAQVIGSFHPEPPKVQNDSTEPVDVSRSVTSNESIAHADDIPILWVRREDMLKRRPDLATQIARLNDDELAFLAERIGDALEEFYWIQLNVVLSLFLDHELALYLQTAKREKRTVT